jgi:hypothetical protein
MVQPAILLKLADIDAFSKKVKAGGSDAEMSEYDKMSQNVLQHWQ